MADGIDYKTKYERALKAINDAEKAKKELDKISRRSDATAPYCSFCRRGKGQYLFCVEGHDNTRICESCVVDAYIKVINELEEQ